MSERDSDSRGSERGCEAPGCTESATRVIETVIGTYDGTDTKRGEVHLCQAHLDEVMADYEPWPDWYLEITR